MGYRQYRRIEWGTDSKGKGECDKGSTGKVGVGYTYRQGQSGVQAREEWGRGSTGKG